MLNFQGQLAQSVEPLSDTHHDILSIGRPSERNLLSHVQFGPVDPLALLLSAEASFHPLPTSSLLSEVIIEPAPEPIQQATEKSVMIERDQRLSQSLLWRIQENYYKDMGINAWENNVPSFITSSAYIADHYAEMILAFLEDYWPHLDLSQPLYIVELATGTGRFSHMVLHELESKLSCFERYRDLQWKYVMTDFTDSNPAFWSKHEKLKPFIERGRVDFAVLNPLAQDRFQLHVSGVEVSADTIKNPVIAIANYFFDTIPHDVFRIEAKQLMEGLVSLERHLEAADGPIDPESPPHIMQITPHWRYQALHNDRCYEDERLNAVLRHYKHTIQEGSIIFPVGAFQVLKNMENLANGRLMLISSDKSYTNVDHMISFYEHYYAIHDGAFSYMVNYDAIGQAFRQAGGQYFHTTAMNLSIQTVCCLSMPETECRFERLAYLYRQRIDRVNMINSVCTLMPDGRTETDILKMDRLIAQLRLNMADPKMFILIAQDIIDLLPHTTWGQREDLLALMAMAWERYYHFPGEVNLPFWLSQLSFYMDRFGESLVFLDKTIQDFGEHEALYFLKGQNHEKLGQWRQAMEMYEKSMQIQPEFDDARQALIAMRHRIKSA